ncbi:Oidioi.mRNA.OKI2018_I69.chr1.g409.t1.cds [Oikopleura dioica]|uniref:Oidioi.mRNA.OKI2018_I69.chr1.g409.t1.cds n=1 Tax=Oikopleura dioica TaxID=34765 RepID=A0ABN7SPT5_OIKDI|nr:Oidioi.mRNA.OKI2018_I69.chr1.g409.t1.cds [Oikopleura dioica]
MILTQRKLKKATICYVTVSSLSIAFHVLIFTLTTIASGCVSGIGNCPKTPFPLIGHGIWCGAGGFLCSAICILLASDKTKSKRSLKMILLVGSVFMIMFSSFGSIADGYGCLMLLTCFDCALFKSQISTILFLLLFLECIVLLTLSVLSFVMTLLNGQDILPLSIVKAPKIIKTSRQKRKLRRSQDPTEPADWTCSYLNPNPLPQRMDFSTSYHRSHSRIDLDYSHCPTLEVGNVSIAHA